MDLFNKRVAWLAVAGAFVFILAQFVFRPPWRDEYYSLFFAAPHLGFGEALTAGVSQDVHPPLYPMMLHFWLQVSENEIYAKALNLIMTAIAFGLGWRLRADRPGQTAVYLFLCVTSFWFVFFANEIRQHATVYLACMLSVLAARNVHERTEKRYQDLLAFLAVCMFAAGLHYFAALWVSTLGFCLGVAFLLERKPAAFVATGVATLLAIVPVLVWMVIVRPDQGEAVPDVLPPFLDNLEGGLNQFLRGMVKSFISAWPAWIAGILGLGALFRSGRGGFEKAVIGAIALTVLISFTIHLGVAPMIKERAYIVIIPGLLFLFSSGMLAIEARQTRAKKIARWVPYMALIALPLFSTEYFKDREEADRMTAYISSFEACEGAPILMYERPDRHGGGFSAYFTRTVTRHAHDGAGLNLLEINRVNMEVARDSWQESACPVRAVAMSLPRGNGRRDREMREDLQAAGLALDNWREERFGEGRSVVFVEDGTGE